MADLTLRARRILQAVVQEYLSSGDAVGSRTVTRRHGIDLSPATVRNVMADLEELGLLRQPHTSAGRVPTEHGLRFFIHSLLKVRSLSSKEKDDLRQRYAMPGHEPQDFDDALQRSSRMLSDLARQAAVVVTPRPERQRLEHLEFVRLPGGDILAVLVAGGGHVENKLIRLESPPDPGALERINNYLATLVAGRTLDELRVRVAEDLGKESIAAEALRVGENLFQPGAAPDLIVTGQAHLLEVALGPGGAEGPDAKTKVRALLAALEEKQRVLTLLDRTLEADGIQVWLGAETPFAGLGEVSVIAANYGPEDKPVGSIAVIGPARMNYSKVIPLVDFTAELVSDLLEK